MYMISSWKDIVNSYGRGMWTALHFVSLLHLLEKKIAYDAFFSISCNPVTIEKRSSNDDRFSMAAPRGRA